MEHKALQAYARPAMWPEDFAVLHNLAQGARLSKPALLRLALERLMRADETPFQAGERLSHELANEAVSK